MKTILIYYVNDYAENGGGQLTEIYEKPEEALEALNKYAVEWGHKLTSYELYEILKEIKVVPVERVTEYKLERDV